MEMFVFAVIHASDTIFWFNKINEREILIESKPIPCVCAVGT